MSLRGFTSWAPALSTLVALGCGARTTLDQDDYLTTGGVSGKDGSARGGSAAGGQGGQPGGGEAGIATGGGVQGGMPSTGGVAGVAGVPVGGSVGVGGSVAGAGGEAGGIGRGQIKGACESFCGPYSMACPADAGTMDDCTWNCMSEFGDAQRECRDMTLEALDCLGIYFNPNLGCDQAMLTAVDACFEIVQQAQDCVDGGVEPPPPPPPSCPGSYYTGVTDCSATLMCPNAYYYASCYMLDDGMVACTCSDDFGGSTSFVSGVPLDSSCSYALELCGYPY